MSATRVAVAITDGVADVRLTRPEKRNALDPEMFVALVRTAMDLRDERSVRAVVLSGDGPDFCAGLDRDLFREHARGNRSTDGITLAKGF